MSNYFYFSRTNNITIMQGEFLSLFDATLDSQKLILSIFKKLSNHSRPGDMWARLVPHIDEEEFNSLYYLIDQGEINLNKSYKYLYLRCTNHFEHKKLSKDLNRLEKGIYYEEKALHFFTKWCKRILKLDELRKKEQIKEYNSRPEVRERQRKYQQRPEVKERKRIYDKEYRQIPEVKERSNEMRRRRRNNNGKN
jgi:crotonobetainyl-CoA:carnitine CoA-transferase CaiB-like acyl-CoA transferase